MIITTVRVFVRGEDGSKDSFCTTINRRAREAHAYYLDQWWNMGTETDRMMKCYKVKILKTKCKGWTTICSHRIHWWYCVSDVIPNFDDLPECEEEHIRKLLCENYAQGELCYCDEDDKEFYGWWKIER